MRLRLSDAKMDLPVEFARPRAPPLSCPFTYVGEGMVGCLECVVGMSKEMVESFLICLVGSTNVEGEGSDRANELGSGKATVDPNSLDF
jgi:hypothetical protein